VFYLIAGGTGGYVLDEVVAAVKEGGGGWEG
jgi:hypothetical protein